MRTTKGTSASKVGRGFITITPETGNRSDYISWQVEEPYRYWIHSRLLADGETERYCLISFELELADDEASKVPTKQELDARAKLAVSKPTPTEIHKITTTSFRNLPIGKLLSTHARIIAEANLEAAQKNKKAISLVKDYESRAIRKNDSSEMFFEIEVDDNLKLGATRRDSILIAYLYSKQVESGSSKPASNVAVLLRQDVKTIYTAIRIARRNGWLTSGGAGKSDGNITSEGIQILREFEKDELVKTYVGNNQSGLKGKK